MIQRLIYLGYYLKNLNFKLYRKFLLFAKRESNKSAFCLIVDSVKSVLGNNISLLEYFQFGFYKLNKHERNLWAGTGYMYEYQRLMNPVDERNILDDKVLFCKSYKSFIKRRVFAISELNDENIRLIITCPSNKIVFKAKNGNCGKQVEIKSTNDFNSISIIDFMKSNGYDMAEEFIIQHPLLTDLSPNSVNTVRIFTNLNKYGGVELLGCRLRLGIDKNVDNLASGGVAVAVDEESGIVISDGVYSDMTKKPEKNHPVSGIILKGFNVPFWVETIEMVKQAALLYPQNRSIGWDIAITNDGPELIEGNHDWCKLVYQLPIHKGLKPELDRYKNEYLSK